MVQEGDTRAQASGRTAPGPLAHWLGAVLIPGTHSGRGQEIEGPRMGKEPMGKSVQR